jgi:hypothetical protein
MDYLPGEDLGHQCRDADHDGEIPEETGSEAEKARLRKRQASVDSLSEQFTGMII